MSSTLSRSASLPQLSPRWTTGDAAAAQSDRAEGTRAAQESAGGEAALHRHWHALAAEGARDLLRLYGECARLLEDRTAKRERLRHELDGELVGQAASNQRQHDDRVAVLKREAGPESAAYKERAARAEDAARALRAVRAEVNGRPLRTGFGWGYPVMMLLLALAEVPVNRAAFELTFREEPVFSLLLAAAVGVILVFFAHVVGLLLRRWPRRPRVGPVLARLGALALLLPAVGAGVYVMARMRQGFMQLVSAEGEGFAQRLQEALRGDAQGSLSGSLPGAVAATAASDLPLGVGDWTFIAVNGLVFLFGVVASFLRHDPHPDYERAIRDGRRTERAFAKVERRYGAKVREETARYEERKRALEGQMGELRATMAALADQAGGIRGHCAAARQVVAQTLRRRCLSFAEGYRAASGGDEPLAPPSTDALLAELPVPEAAIRDA